MKVSYDPSLHFPTFSRLLSRGSRFRRVLEVGWAGLACAVAAHLSMVLIVNVGLAFWWHGWKTLEYVGPSQSIVLPISMLVASVVASFVGAQLGLSRVVRALAVICGLLLFYGDRMSWLLPGRLLGLMSPGFEPSLLPESVARTAYGESMGYAAMWGSLALWAAVGLVVGAAFRLPERRRIARMLGGVLGMLTVAVILLGSIFYPLVVVEKREIEQSYKRINNLAQRCRELEKPSRHDRTTTDAH